MAWTEISGPSHAMLVNTGPDAQGYSLVISGGGDAIQSGILGPFSVLFFEDLDGDCIVRPLVGDHQF